MLHSVTWTHYLVAVLSVATAYYAFVGIRFYANDIKSLVSRNPKGKNESRQLILAQAGDEYPPTDPDQLELSFADTADGTFEQVEDLIGKIRAAVAQEADKGGGTGPLARTLGLLLAGHADLKGSHFQHAISELIRNECEKLGFPAPNEAEMQQLWG